MKKIVVLMIAVLTLAGCQLSNSEIAKLTDQYLNKTVELEKHQANHLKKGYKFYVPKSADIIYSDESNDILLLDSNQITLYVDLVESFYKKTNNTTYTALNEKDLYLERNFDEGYIKIYRSNNQLTVYLKYNQATLTSTVEEADVPSVIGNMLLIARSVETYNDVVEKMVGQERLISESEEITAFNPIGSKDTSDEYQVEYVEPTSGSEESFVGAPISGETNSSSSHVDGEFKMEDNSIYNDYGTGE